jgi:uncharacterized protein YbjT (DUF2867 family)
VRILVVGASGFIGRRVVAALGADGHAVVAGVRDPAGFAGEAVAVDLTRDLEPADWAPRLAGVDVVINAVGILRESGRQTFDALHDRAPRALFAACAQAGVRKVIQISALGADADARSRYHLSKRAADRFLAATPLAWVIVQPSLVFGPGGASARLFALLASLPLIPVPGDGGQRVQPVHVDDLVQGIARLVVTDAFDARFVAAVGPVPLTLRAFLAALRAQLHPGRAARFAPVPMPIVRLAAAAGERLPGALLDRETLQMLERGNEASAEAFARLLGRAPRPVEQFVPASEAPALATAAQLDWLLPLLRAAVAIVWIVTAIVSFGVYPVAESYALLARVGITGALAPIALYGSAALDLAFGVGIYVLRDRRWLWRAQAALIVGYSVIIALWLPELWLHPFGPLLKNLPMLAVIVALHELERR